MNHQPTRKILWVDLSTGRTWSEPIAPELYRLLPGGRGLAANLLLEQMPPGADPFGPDNLLLLAVGLLTGAPFSTATRFSAVARSPLSGGYGESEAGGFWGPELRLAGWEAIALRGQAAHPVYLWVRDGAAELRDARHLWGREPEEVQSTLREEVGDRLARVLQIGIGGEKRVRFAAMTNELRHFNGRSGMGAVMGAKNLKAVVVRGTGRIADAVAEAAPLGALGKRLAKAVKEHPIAWDLQTRGTPGITGGLQAAGILPTCNFRGGAFEQADKIAWDAYETEILSGRRSCYACAVRCKREVAAEIAAGARYDVSKAYGGPEYEAVAGFGSNCGVGDIQAVAKANELCNRFTLDAISTAGTVAFAMECYEAGLIGPNETGGLDLRFGNASAMLQLVEQIAHREGIGDLLAEGSARAAAAIGGGAEAFALHVKGQELPMHDPRGKAGVALGYAVSEAGADHLTAVHDPMLANPESLSFRSAAPLGITQALAPLELGCAKVRQYALMEHWNSFEKCVGLCFFGPIPRSFIEVDDVLAAMRAAGGWEVDVAELLAIGERATNLARLVNVREGFTRADDRLPERLFQPLQSGALAGTALDRSAFEAALTLLYEFKGWDPQTAAPTPERLHALGIGWAARHLERRAAAG